ncbi:MAG: DUF6095 family protein [Flavicella sp.]
MSTDTKELKRGLKYIFGALPLISLGPILISIGYSAIKKQQNYLYICLGFIAAIAAILLVFVGLRIILNSLFSD